MLHVGGIFPARSCLRVALSTSERQCLRDGPCLITRLGPVSLSLCRPASASARVVGPVGRTNLVKDHRHAGARRVGQVRPHPHNQLVADVAERRSRRRAGPRARHSRAVCPSMLMFVTLGQVLRYGVPSGTKRLSPGTDRFQGTQSIARR